MDDLRPIVSVKLDTSELDNAANMSTGDADLDWALEPLTDLFSEASNLMNTGADKAAEELSNRLRSLQEWYIASNKSIQSGALVTSIDALETDERTYEVGTVLAEFYPLCIEYGRNEVVPVHAKALRWFVNGDPVFSKYSRATNPKPYVQPAFEKVDSEAETIVLEAINNVIN